MPAESRSYELSIRDAKKPIVPWLAAGAAIWSLALWFDYGFKWSSQLESKIPCAEAFQAILKEPRPIFLSGDGTNEFCRADVRHFYGLTKAPIIQKFWEGPAKILISRNSSCSQTRDRVLAAQQASGAPVWWWFSGTPEEWSAELKCLGQSREGAIFEAVSPDKSYHALRELAFSAKPRPTSK